MKKNSHLPKLIVADTERDADQLYATRFFAPDPFLFLEENGRRTIVLSDLEIDRGRADAQVDEVVPLSDISAHLPKGKDAPFGEHVAQFLKLRRVRRAHVPQSFPLGLADELSKNGITLVPQPGLFWPAREGAFWRVLAQRFFQRWTLPPNHVPGGVARALSVFQER